MVIATGSFFDTSNGPTCTYTINEFPTVSILSYFSMKKTLLGTVILTCMDDNNIKRNILPIPILNVGHTASASAF
ncbi:hypothetical protein KDA_05040 [Dictyobacter alpinus]|uniref:Uncharacterized protein n=1 Tax=Dictyobacter alpinus TaxID=2014873 RepID=A0A402B0Z0_9CHLR|nr:hypothetical protein KDA_05040 [Dictyobacter alpinus]